MKLLNCKVTNFGSYKELEFDYSNKGLAMIYGSTGTGKSTLMDAPCWCLFGVTAKNGSVDDVRNWNNPDNPTVGQLNVKVDGVLLEVVRTRGKPTQNDLYWVEDGHTMRGKDITETQKFLEIRIGTTAEIYCASAYYSEFSPSASFFTDKAKDKRALLENVANLEMATELSSKIAEMRKISKTSFLSLEKDVEKAKDKVNYIISYLGNIRAEINTWEEVKAAKVKDLLLKAANFEEDHNRLVMFITEQEKQFDLEIAVRAKELKRRQAEQKPEKTCPTCGVGEGNLERQQVGLELAMLLAKPNPYTFKLEKIKSETNNYESASIEEGKKINPFISTREKLLKDEDLQLKLHESLLKDLTAAKHRLSSLNQLVDMVATLRGHLLKNSLDRIQTTTNDYLTRFFDSEFTLSAELEGSDDISVKLFKNGNECNFRQLSKGQRGLLKLTFALAVMKETSNKSGSHFSTIFLDESVDGLDSDLKIKAFNLFCELEKEHESVLVIDHSLELRAMFTNKLEVTLLEDNSIIVEV